MAADKEAFCLSRVHMYFPKRNRPHDIFCILLSGILTLLACTQSVYNVFHTCTVFYDYVLSFKPFFSILRVKSCNLVNLPVFIYKENNINK